MADHPLRPAKRHSLGRPLPYQLADATQTHPLSTGLAVPVFKHNFMRNHGVIGYYLYFHRAMSGYKEDYLRVPNPFAAIPLRESLDLHA